MPTISTLLEKCIYFTTICFNLNTGHHQVAILIYVVTQIPIDYNASQCIIYIYIQFLYIIPQWIPYRRFTFYIPHSIISIILYALVSLTIPRGVTKFSRITKWKWGMMDLCHLTCVHLSCHLECSRNR
jgi:hypothetical protein